MPKITYVIPCYNMEQWLPVAVESCLWQSDPDIEVLIVNDGSKDGSAKVADLYAQQDDRVRVIHQENKGLGATRQVGQDNAKGEYVTWLDADDFLDRDATKNLYAVAKRDGVDAVCGNAVVFSDKTFNTRKYFHHPEAANLNFATAPRYWKSKVVWRWIYRLETLKRLGVQHAHYKMGQDVCFNFLVLPNLNGFSQCPSFFYYFRQDHKSGALSMEVMMDHQLKHFKSAIRPLVASGDYKPLVKYLQENFQRDTKKLAKRIPAEGDQYKEVWLEMGLDLFSDLKTEWFREEALAPEVQCDKNFVPLAIALCQGDKTTAMSIFNSYIPKPKPLTAPLKQNKQGTFHSLRRKLKSYIKPLSFMARSRLRNLEKLAAKRLG